MAERWRSSRRPSILAPERVGILLGIAECHRRLGETAKTPEEALGRLRLALAVYENYLYNTRNREPPPPERSGVPEKLAALQKDIERIEADRDAARKLTQFEAEKQAFVAMRAAETAAQRLQEEKNRQAAEQASRLLRDAVAVGETNRRLQEEQLAEHRRRRRSRKARVAAALAAVALGVPGIAVGTTLRGRAEALTVLVTTGELNPDRVTAGLRQARALGEGGTAALTAGSILGAIGVALLSSLLAEH